MELCKAHSSRLRPLRKLSFHPSLLVHPSLGHSPLECDLLGTDWHMKRLDYSQHRWSTRRLVRLRPHSPAYFMPEYVDLARYLPPMYQRMVTTYPPLS
ncbi:hypothetical protein AB1N83_005714 [Pleurotus pulmonarius]